MGNKTTAAVHSCAKQPTPSTKDRHMTGHTGDRMDTTGDAAHTARIARHVSQLGDMAGRAEREAEMDDIAWRRQHSAAPSGRRNHTRIPSDDYTIAGWDGEPVDVKRQYLARSGVTRSIWQFPSGERFATFVLGRDQLSEPHISEFSLDQATSLN